MKIALTGNPNSGKTTLFNTLTGKLEYTGNWAGVTVDKKEANLKDTYAHGIQDVVVVDLPGAYSMSAFTSEEAITSDFVKNEAPDVIINIIDSTNLSRSLFFTTQLLELGIPVVVALNKQDMTDKQGTVINTAKLAQLLSCKVVQISAINKTGLNTLTKMAMKQVEQENSQVAPDIGIIGEIHNKEEQIKADKVRYTFVNTLIKDCETKQFESKTRTTSDKVDSIIAHKWLGLPIFFLIMWAVYWFSQQGLGGYLSGYLNDTLFGETIPTAAGNLLESMNVSPFLQAMLIDGMLAGVGAVLGFLPLIMVLFFCLSLLEDCGYMARVAVVMDRFFKKIGLSGKSIIPMIVGTGCAIPGIMATRTIENQHERRMAIILTPFVPCSAKLPIIALFAAVFFPTHSWVGPSIYIIAILVIIIAGLLLKNMFKLETNSSIFIMELPSYKWPSLKNAFIQMLDKAKSFIVKAGTIILVCNTFIWLTQTYDFSLQIVEDPNLSILAIIGTIIAPIFIPLGFMGWQLAASCLTGFVAKENVVASLAVMLITTEAMLESSAGSPLLTVLTPVTAFAFMIFNLFTPPCFAAMGAMNSEMGDKKWLGIGILFQVLTGYTLAMLVTQIGTFIVTGAPATGLVPAIIILGLEIFFYIYITKKNNKRVAVPV